MFHNQTVNASTKPKWRENVTSAKYSKATTDVRMTTARQLSITIRIVMISSLFGSNFPPFLKSERASAVCCRCKPWSFLQEQLFALTLDILHRVRYSLSKRRTSISQKVLLSIHVHLACQMCVFRAPKGISLSNFDLARSARARTTRYEQVSFQEMWSASKLPQVTGNAKFKIFLLQIYILFLAIYSGKKTPKSEIHRIIFQSGSIFLM